MLISLKQTRGACLLFLLVFLSYHASSQITQNERFETSVRPGETIDNYAVISAQEQGLIIYNLLSLDGKTFLHISRLDTTLTEVWTGSIDIDRNVTPRKAVVRNGVLFLLCKSPTSANFLLVTVNLESKNYTKYVIRNFIPFNPSDFISTGESVMIGGYFNYRAIVIHYSLATNGSKMLPGFFNDQGELLQLKVSDDNVVDVIVSTKNTERKQSLWLRNYDADGNLIKTTILEPDADKNLIFGRSVKMKGEDQVVAGVYGRSKQFARGIFVARINPYGEYKINYYNFGDMKNFFSYMKASREKRVRTRIERRKIKGKKIRFNYRFLVHELIPYKDQYVMLGEAFYPVYKSVNNIPFFMGGGTPVSSRFGNRGDYIFDGYQYTHAVVIGLSSTGELLWDNSFEINDIRSFTLDQQVKIQPEPGHINLLYLHNNLFRTKIIEGNEVLEGKTFEPVKTKFPDDIAIPETNSKNKVEYWYNDRFYAFGIQRITNAREAGMPLSRRVFYINKITSK
jgi:hypothetical protein